MIECRAPKDDQEFQQYYQLRWEVLRKPWQQPRGSEQDELERQAVHRMVINELGRVCAVGRLHFTDKDQAQIRFMAVDEAEQRKGYGQLIIKALEQAALDVGIQKISLNAREQACAFYRTLGYEGEQISHVLYEQIPHIKMEKALAVSPKKNTLTEQLMRTWHQTIPLSKAMDIYIANYSGVSLVCSCNVNANKNLHNTMFAGSIYTLATLTGWGAIYLKLAEQQLAGDIVLAHANISYKAPIPDVAFAKTEHINHSIDLTELEKKGRARITLTVNVFSGETVAAIFEGSYVVKALK
ncbi:bifunctional GNAT family N-acetyltransferase/hotdog fold thioesterase [Thalassotalea ganghwensis]